MSDIVEWNGQLWYWYKDYHRNRRGQLLHREVYRAAHGPIGPGVQVHHIDGDKKNWRLANLVALSTKDHRAEHERTGWAAWSTERRKANSADAWKAREPQLVACRICGSEFLSTGMRAKYCGDPCRREAARLQSVGRPRPIREPKPRKIRSDRRPDRPCVVCGKEFWTHDPATVCCGKPCGYVLRARRRLDG